MEQSSGGSNPPFRTSTRTSYEAMRVTPAHDWQYRRVAPEVWLLCERGIGDTPRTKHYFVNMAATAAPQQIVRPAHQRWVIEQQYTDITYNFLEAERLRARANVAFTDSDRCVL